MSSFFGRRLGICCRFGRSFIFEYETPRLVTLQSPVLGIINRLVQIFILAYLIGYVFIYTKGYQEFDTAESSVVTKIKGILHHNSNKREIWDSIDFVIPSQENGAFFIATNLLYTSHQKRGICPEDPNIGEAGIWCKDDADCISDEPSPMGNGLKTGRCVLASDSKLNISVCEIFGWCATELDKTPKQPVLGGFETITVLVKNNIAFPHFDKKRRNILDSINQTYLQRCRFHPSTDPLCPIFSIKDIVEEAGENFTELAIRGGIIGFNINWECNLDFDIEYCIPQYFFRRLDSKTDKIAKGWNFRHAYYHYDVNGTMHRDLMKFWGIRFIFYVNGRAGRFSAVIFAMNVGSGLGLLGLASLVSEFVLLNCVKSNYGLQLLQRKFTNLEGSPCNDSSRTSKEDIAFPISQNCDYMNPESLLIHRTAPIIVMHDI